MCSCQCVFCGRMQGASEKMPATAETQAQQQHLLTRLPFWPRASTHSSTTTLSHWAFLPITKGWPGCTLISTMLVSPNSSLPQAPSGRRRLMWSAFVSASEAWFSSHARACPVSRARGTRARTWPTRCRGAGPVLDVKAAVCASFRHHHQGDDVPVFYGQRLGSHALTIHCAPRPVRLANGNGLRKTTPAHSCPHQRCRCG